MHELALPLLIGLIAIALAFDFLNGLHDAANSIATVVATRLFSAAANLAELGCGFDLAWGLLSEAGLDSGLSPSEVKRQIACGLDHGRRNHQVDGLTITPPEPSGMEAGN